ncbi:uncharacterized [Tachysurus ichikawai]
MMNSVVVMCEDIFLNMTKHSSTYDVKRSSFLVPSGDHLSIMRHKYHVPGSSDLTKFNKEMFSGKKCRPGVQLEHERGKLIRLVEPVGKEIITSMKFNRLGGVETYPHLWTYQENKLQDKNQRFRCVHLE